MKTPGPDHPIHLEPASRRWRARFGGHVIADTADALILHEASLPPVVYFPRADVEMGYMGRTNHQTHCPYKGDAAYYTLTLDGRIAENVAWSYETPFEAMGPITGRIAFYRDRVDVYAVGEALPSDRREIDEIVQHTDAGDGTSQRDHWPANVEEPEAPPGGVR
jgi:uncharacterized protein (DUF427 family)